MQTSTILTSENTSKGQNWSCKIIPYDSFSYGTSKNSSNITILNTAPNATTVNLTSSDSLNRTNGTLTGTWTFNDDDSTDSEQNNETKWYKNGAIQNNLTNLTSINSGNTTKEDNWTFSIRVNDGTDWSNFENSSQLTITNTAPNTTTPTLNSTSINNHTTDNLTCHFTINDDKGFYHCFGCGAHGDVISFLMVSEGYSFLEAIENLASKAGIKMPQISLEDHETARRRADPGHGWAMPGSIFFIAWFLMACGYSYAGYTKLISPSWIDGSAIEKILDSPLVRPAMLRDAVLDLPNPVLWLMSWSGLGFELAFAPLALFRRLRPWLWQITAALSARVCVT